MDICRQQWNAGRTYGMAKGPRPLNSEAFVIQVGRACRIHHPSGVCAPNLPAFARACTFMVCMCADWTSRYPFAVSGRRAGGSWGKGAGTAVSIIRLGSCSGSGGGLAGRICFCSWLSLDPRRSQESSAPSLSRVVRGRLGLCLTLAEKKLAWKEATRHSHLSSGPAGPAGAA